MRRSRSTRRWEVLPVDVERATPGCGGLHLVDGVPLLRPEEQVFAAMLDGWRNQQLARNLSFGDDRERGSGRSGRSPRTRRRYPWQWLPQMVDEWCSDLRAVRGLRRSTLRGYQEAVRLFCAYLTDPAYGWAGECEQRFGTHPVQVVHEWNTAVHVAGQRGRPAQAGVHRRRAAGVASTTPTSRSPGSGRGPQGLAAGVPGRDPVQGRLRLRAAPQRDPDARRRRLRPQPARRRVRRATACCHVRHGKAMKGSPPKRRSVLTVWAWVPDILDEWITEVRPLLAVEGNPALWPSERGAADRAATDQHAAVAAYRDALGLDPGWTSTRCAAPTSPT